MENIRKKRMVIHIHPIDTDKTIKRVNDKIRFVKDNLVIGGLIRVKPVNAYKDEYMILRLDRIEGNHYIFASKHGWVQSYTMAQLCFDISDGKIKILKEDNKNDKK